MHVHVWGDTFDMTFHDHMIHFACEDAEVKQYDLIFSGNWVIVKVYIHIVNFYRSGGWLREIYRSSKAPSVTT
jgi:hypothetical protein